MLSSRFFARAVLPAMFAAAALAVGASSAGAATRYASPLGAGTICSQPTPCSFITAIGPGGVSGDVVSLAGGDYPAITTLVQPASGGLTVQGASRTDRAVLHITGNGQLEFYSGGLVQDLDIDSVGNYTALRLQNGAIANRLRVTNHTAYATAADAIGATVENSILLATGTNGFALQTGPNGADTIATVRGSTLISTGPSGIGYSVFNGVTSNTTANVTNTIIIGTGSGIYSSTATAGASTIVNLSHSSVNSQVTKPGGCACTVNAPVGNQLAVSPKLVSLPLGDIHQLVTSPTIGAGIDDPLNGPLDVDGDARTIGATDIGADEFVPPVAPIDTVVPTPTPTPAPSSSPTPAPSVPPAKPRAAALVSSKLTVKKGVVTLRLSCPASAGALGCAGDAAVRLSKSTTPSVGYKLAAGKTGSVKIKLSKRQAAKVTRAGRAATVTLAVGGATIKVVLRRR